MVSIPLINYDALVEEDASELGKLIYAGHTAGIFYLDLRGPQTRAVFEDMPVIFQNANIFFNLPQDSKEKTESLRTGVGRGYVSSSVYFANGVDTTTAKTSHTTRFVSSIILLGLTRRSPATSLNAVPGACPPHLHQRLVV